MSFEKWLLGPSLLQQYRKQWSRDFQKMMGLRLSEVPQLPNVFWYAPRPSFNAGDLTRLLLLRLPRN